jgi:tetratricopeptide (TPR) repeat protein
VLDRNQPTALISYSHDSPEHESRVLSLCNRLRSRGVDAFVDQFLAGAPREGWPLWMERQIAQRDFTLMVCTQTYLRRFMEDEASGVGRGVVWEARILRNLLYEDSAWQARVVPVIFDDEARSAIPTVFHGHFYDISDDRGFETLLRHLLRTPGATASALGALGPEGSRWSAFERPWLVPDALKTRYFTGRDHVLDALHRQLRDRKRAVVSGLGGVGKTQTAIEYAVRHRQEYPDGVFWTNAASESALTSGFIEIAKALDLAASAAADQEQAVKATLEWLNGTDRWLLIFDNAEDRRALSRFIPGRGKGDVLITSRESVFQEIGIVRGLDLTDFANDDAVTFLLIRTGRDESDAAAAGALADELGRLPLALEQAAAYIAETNASFADYLSSFRKRRITLLERAKGLVAHETIATTWSENFAAVEEASPAAADVLRLSSVLDAGSIPFEMFSKGAAALGKPVAGELSDPEDELAVTEMLRPLVRYSLIRSDATARTFSIHRLVQETIRDSIGEAGLAAFVERAARALTLAFPGPSYEARAMSDRLIPHIVSLAGWIDALRIRTGSAAALLSRTGWTLFQRSRYAEAERLITLAVAIDEALPDCPPVELADCLRNLGSVHWVRGRYGDALSLYRRALEIWERADGSSEAEIARCLNNIAVVETELRRFAEAERLYERAAAIGERALGADHSDVLTILSGLANNIRQQNRYGEAETLHRRVLSVRERTLGPDHPEVAFSLNNIGDVLEMMGRYEEAQGFYERALVIWEGSHGKDHRLVAHPLLNLASLYRRMERLDDALAFGERALALLERTLSAQHPDVANMLVILSDIHRDRGEREIAIGLLERALAIREIAFHPDVPEPEDLRAMIERLRVAAGDSPAAKQGAS